MNPDEAKRAILDNVRVTPQMVVIAKAIIFEACKDEAQGPILVDVVLSKQGAIMPKSIILDGINEASAVKAIADAMSWRLAAMEAIWSLVHTNLFVPGPLHECGELVLPYVMGPPAGNTTSSNITFEKYHLQVPRRVHRAPSSIGNRNCFLTDPDLFLHTLGITNMHGEVADALREAVKCFRADLFIAAVAMMGKASEGAWLELGISLINKVPPGQLKSVGKQSTALEDSQAGTMKKIQAVLTLYDRIDIFGTLAASSGIRRQELAFASQWSDLVRDSRNTIHFGVSPATPNTYEKVAALLLGVAPHMRVLYKVKTAADAI